MKRIVAVSVLSWLVYACASTTPQPVQPQIMHGVASWYGQEFAGRTTANGEIFDPLLLTAAHRSLPFGTLVDVKNSKTNQVVRVRINDRGPYVGNRLIDLSYAAAQQISLVEPGSGDVDVYIVRMGKGELEPPAPYVVTVPDKVDPLPVVTAPAPAKVVAVAPAPVVVAPPPAPADFSVQVVEERKGVVTETRRQVSPDGRTIETVDVATSKPVPAPPRVAPDRGTAAALDRAQAPRPVAPVHVTADGKFVVQVGAFAQEANAKSLQERLTHIGQQSWIDRTTLFRVKIGPFATRDQAIKTRENLEAAGISAIIVGN